MKLVLEASKLEEETEPTDMARDSELRIVVELRLSSSSESQMGEVAGGQQPLQFWVNAFGYSWIWPKGVVDIARHILVSAGRPAKFNKAIQFSLKRNREFCNQMGMNPF